MADETRGQVTLLLEIIRDEQVPYERRKDAKHRLAELLYTSWCEQARRVRRREGGCLSLETGDLVSEAVARAEQARLFQTACDSRHLLGAMTLAMRQILIDEMRRKRSRKRGGGLSRIDLAGTEPPDRGRRSAGPVPASDALEPDTIEVREDHRAACLETVAVDDLLVFFRDCYFFDQSPTTRALLEALGDLKSAKERVFRVLVLRSFYVFTVEEVATLLRCSPRTVVNDFSFAQKWLIMQLGSDDP